VLLHAHGYLDTLEERASRSEADADTAQMLLVQGQLVVHFVTRFSPLRIDDPLLLKVSERGRGSYRGPWTSACSVVTASMSREGETRFVSGVCS